ncbi:MAG TPA: glycosyltransferase [Frankiaceae bacterium]|nr:glycosyltransferase [Frankiaceae bacterium]
MVVRRVEIVVGRYRPDRDGVSAYVERLVAALPAVGLRATVTEWPGVWHFRPRADSDLVHVQFAPSAYSYSGGIGLAPLGTRLPLVTTLHEYGWWTWTPLERPDVLAAAEQRLSRLFERPGRWDRETLLLAPASRALVVTGRGHADVVRDRLGRAARVIPIGANVGVAYPGDRMAARRELGLAADVPLVAFFGFVHPVKGLRYLIEAVAALRASSAPGLRIVAVGGWRSLAWPDEEADAFIDELRGLAADAGLPDEALTFTGFADEEAASRWLRAADLAALPFTHGITAKSGSLLTCWAHGLPVVATEPPDGPDEDAVGAVLPARPRDAATLRTALGRLLQDEAERTRLAAVGAERMAGRTWAAVATAHAALYDEVLGS